MRATWTSFCWCGTGWIWKQTIQRNAAVRGKGVRLPELVKRVREFRAQLGEYCDRDPNPGVVYQINLQVFPLSSEPDDS